MDHEHFCLCRSGYSGKVLLSARQGEARTFCSTDHCSSQLHVWHIPTCVCGSRFVKACSVLGGERGGCGKMCVCVCACAAVHEYHSKEGRIEQEDQRKIA
eukprot:6467585-Amphidinium_carterae.1